MIDSYRQIALDAIDALGNEESTTEGQFKCAPWENYHEESRRLRARLETLDRYVGDADYRSNVLKREGLVSYWPMNEKH